MLDKADKLQLTEILVLLDQLEKHPDLPKVLVPPRAPLTDDEKEMMHTEEDCDYAEIHMYSVFHVGMLKEAVANKTVDPELFRLDDQIIFRMRCYVNDIGSNPMPGWEEAFKEHGYEIIPVMWFKGRKTRVMNGLITPQKYLITY